MSQDPIAMLRKTILDQEGVIREINETSQRINDLVATRERMQGAIIALAGVALPEGMEIKKAWDENYNGLRDPDANGETIDDEIAAAEEHISSYKHVS